MLNALVAINILDCFVKFYLAFHLSFLHLDPQL